MNLDLGVVVFCVCIWLLTCGWVCVLVCYWFACLLWRGFGGLLCFEFCVGRRLRCGASGLVLGGLESCSGLGLGVVSGILTF